MSPRSTLFLTPGVDGADGLSLFSREVVSAFGRRGPKAGVEVWSLAERSAEGSGVRSARGSRLRFSWWGISQGLFPQSGRRVITLHTHLLPVALPLVQRGAELSHFIVGVDAWKPLSVLETKALRRARRVVAISRHSASEFLRANPSFGDSHIPVCHPGLPEIENGPGNEGGDYALIVGRMSAEERYKGHDLLIEVWGDVRSRRPGASLFIVGGGDDRARLEGKANQLGLAGVIRFLGRVSAPDLDRLYRECAFFVMPSRHEGFGFVFLEAMRAAKAVIGARGAASEIIEDGVTGYVVEPGDRGSLVDAIEKLWTDADARRRMGSRGRERFRAEFTREKFEVRLHDLFPTD